MSRFSLAWIVLAACSSGNGNGNGTGDGGTTGDGRVGDGGGSSDAGDGAHSGTRLKLVWNDYAGTRELAGIRDAQRAETCVLAGWDDGVSYCTPNADTVVYLDASCTQGVGFAYHQTCPTSPPAYFRQMVPMPCGTYQIGKLYATGGARAAPTGYYSKAADGTCTGPSSPQAFDFYDLGGEVSRGDLVATTTSAPVGTGALAVRYTQAADGFQIPAVLYDPALAADCSPVTLAAGQTTVTCRPVESLAAAYFHDNLCTQPEAAQNQACAAPRFLLESTSCAVSEPALFTAMSAVTDAIYTAGTSSCVAAMVSANQVYYPAGAAQTPVALARAHDDGARIDLIHLTTGDVRYRDPALFDSTLGGECKTEVLYDGSTRCVPEDATVFSYYADAACTTPLLIAQIYRGSASCAAPPAPTYGVIQHALPTNPSSCVRPIDVYPVTGPRVGAVYNLVGATCYAVTGSYYGLYEVAAPLDLASLASPTVVVDP